MKNYVVVCYDEDGARVGNIQSYVTGSLSALFLRFSRDILAIEDHERIVDVHIASAELTEFQRESRR